jgi:uncharacterized membrane protein YeaQ/YmgE (transglycosylase-associated protein family)
LREVIPVSVLAWIIVGVFVAALAKMATSKSRGPADTWLGSLLAGAIGALVGGWLWGALAYQGGSGIHPASLVLALAGAAAAIAVARVAQSQLAP